MTDATASKQLLVGALVYALPLTLIGVALAVWVSPGAANMAAGCGILTLMMLLGSAAFKILGD